jgi:hypothetical protein
MTLPPVLKLEIFLNNLRLNPKPVDPRLEALRENYETVLSLLESEFLGAIVSGDWTEFDELINDFRSSQETEEMTSTEDPLAELWALAFPKASTDSLTRSGADSCSSPNNQLVKD